MNCLHFANAPRVVLTGFICFLLSPKLCEKIRCALSTSCHRPSCLYFVVVKTHRLVGVL